MCNQEPDIVATLGLLAHLNNDELSELLQNDNKIEEMVKDVKQVRELGQVKVYSFFLIELKIFIPTLTLLKEKKNYQYFFVYLMDKNIFLVQGTGHRKRITFG